MCSLFKHKTCPVLYRDTVPIKDVDINTGEQETVHLSKPGQANIVAFANAVKL